MPSSRLRVVFTAALLSLGLRAFCLSADPEPAAIRPATDTPLVPTAAPAVPEKPLGQKGALIFSDDFERAELGKDWRVVTPTFTVADGVMTGSQTRQEHGAVASVPAAFQDGIIEFKFRLEGAASINAVCDDKAFTGSHAGHICRVAITPKQIRLGDDKEGAMRNDILEMRRDPARKAEGDQLIVGRGTAVNTPIELHRWYRMTIEIFGDEMRVSLDDRPLGYLKSPGLAHPTKSHFHFTVTGKDAQFDDVRIWSAMR